MKYAVYRCLVCTTPPSTILCAKEIIMLRLPFLLLLFFATKLTAQTLSGFITDSANSPLVAVTVALQRSKDSAVVRYSITDKGGAYRFAIKDSGTYFISATAAGFQPYTSLPFVTTSETISLPPIKLAANNTTLTGVQIISKKPVVEVLPDKTVFNVESSINAAGNNALELLQKSPGVLVDQNDAISVSGKTGVRIYIDGRPSPLGAQDLAQYLRSLSAADIEAIEIISNPSARFKAAGNAGIINFRLKKNKSLGTNASVAGGWSVGVFPKYNGSLSLNHRNKRWNFFGSYGYNQGRNRSYLNLYRFQADSIFDQQSITTFSTAAHNIRAGADFFIDAKQTVGVLLNSNISETDFFTRSTTPISAQATKTVERTLLAQNTSTRERKNITANINYRKQIKSSEVLSADVDFGYYNLDGVAYIPNTFISKTGATEAQIVFGNNTPVTIQMWSGKIDYERNVNGGKLTTGLRTQWVQTTNSFLFFNYTNNRPQLDSDRSNNFYFSEAINALYGQYQKTVKKWNYNVGLRAEQTDSRGRLTSTGANKDRDVRRSYLNIFPSGGITVQLPKQQTASLSFSRRIDRPSYQDLNPFENRLDELTYQKGNPFLQPQYTNNIELRHSYKYKLNTAIGYSVVQDMFAAITDTIEGARNFITQRNLARQKIWSLSASLPFAIKKWWNVFASISANRNRYIAVFEQGKTIDLKASVLNAYMQHSFTISKKWSAELSGFYVSPYIWAGTYQCRAIGSLDAGVAVKVLKEAGTLKLGGSDLLRTMPWQGTSRFGGLLINASGGWESRLLKLNFTYKFGNAQVKAARQRSTGLEELNKRVQ